MKAIVIGAGIGGLTAAIALRRVGVEVEVYERAPELREVGAGISIWANAIRALDHIGVGDAVRAVGEPMLRAEMRGWSGHRVMVSYDAGELERQMGVPTTVWMTHRAELVGALHNALPSGTASFGREAATVHQNESSVTVRFTDGTEAAADLLIGADGIRSVVRRSIMGDQPVRYSGYTCWRGICDVGLETVPRGYVAELWGVGARVGITRLTRGRVYWWACCNASQGSAAKLDRDASQAHLTQRFAAFPAMWQAILRATPADAIIPGDIVDRPPQLPWSAGRIGLLGDAAHPTTPNLGQGGCMAIEDGVVLARCLRAGSSIESALAEFSRQRIRRASAITRMSWRLGWVGQLSSPLLCAVRDRCFSLAPGPVAFRGILKWARYDTGPVQ